MKKDFSQLGILPSAVWGMLGYSSAIGILRWLSDYLSIPLQTSSVGAIETYRITVAILFALVPWLVLLIGLRKYGTKAQQPFGWYVLGTILLLFSIVAGLTVEMLALEAFQKHVESLVPGEQWLFSIEELHPFRSGFGGLLLASAVLFLLGIWHRKTLAQ